MTWRSTKNWRSRMERELTSRYERSSLALAERCRNVGFDFGLFAAAGAVGEGKISEVARQADSRAHHDVAFRTGAAQPFAGGFREVV